MLQLFPFLFSPFSSGLFVFCFVVYVLFSFFIKLFARKPLRL